MTWRSWLVLLLFCLWSGGSWYWYTCQIKGYCFGDNTWSGIEALNDQEPQIQEGNDQILTEDSMAINESAPMSFRWGSVQMDTSAGFSEEIAQLVAHKQDDKVLEISAPYQMREADLLAVSDVGMSRAMAIKASLSEFMDTTGVLVRGMAVDTIPQDSVFKFADISFRWITNNEQVKELADGALIYFPYKSDERIDDPTITTYLEELAHSLIGGNGSVEVIGHTDDKGSAGYNLKLGQERADAIKRALVDLGVPADRVIATSKGESEPLAPNISEENKARNRRTEIKIK